MNTSKMKLLVTGASGFIGQEVSRLLSIGGYRPKLMIRQPGDDCDICHLDADFVTADLRDHQSLKHAVKGVDGIIHLAGRATFESYDTLKPSILDGSVSLMKAGIEAGIHSFVFSSSLLVYNNTISLVTADTPIKPTLDYGRIKVDTEKELTKLASNANINFAAIRLPHVYGAKDLYFQQIRNGLLILPGMGKNVYTHLHVTDAAAAIIACAEKSFSGVLPIGDQQPSTWAVFLQVVRRYYPNAKILLLPQWIALLATTLLTPFRRFRPYPGLETPGAVRTYNFNIAVDPSILWKNLELKPVYPTIFSGIPAVASERIVQNVI